jgi:imidazoleglycerol phosphate dehydratase HisB
MHSHARRGVALALTVVASAACYHATIETGAKPSETVIDKDWAAGWVYALVPPSTVETASKCPNGVARVETQISFLNGLVALLTFEIYTPMSIKVTCAAANSADASHVVPDVSVASSAGAEAVNAAFGTAAHRSAEAHVPVFVRIE